jgi:protein-S-isoprenylcysteine O-methyltransferase Ste14
VISRKKTNLIVFSSIIFFLVVPVFSLYLGNILDHVLKLNKIGWNLPRITISILLSLIGSYYVLESIRILLLKGQGIPLGDMFPKEQSSKLITSGVYAHTRNPMLFGYLLCIISLGLLRNSISIAFIIPIIFTVLWTIWLKVKEEPELGNRFGELYIKYKEKTPFLIPKISK